MNTAFLGGAAGAVFLGVGVLVGEYARTRGRRFDSFSVFLAIFSLQCLGPSVVIFTCLAWNADRPISLENTFFDRVYSVVEGRHVFLVLSFMAAFLAFTWLTYRAVVSSTGYRPRFRLRLDARTVKFLVTLGFVSGGVLLFTLGGSLRQGYHALVRFRNSDPEIVRTFVTANLFSLTQTFLLIGVLGLFLARRWRMVSPTFFSWAIIVGALALLCVSRRSLLLPPILFLFTVMLAGRRPKFVQLAALALLGGTVLFGGKQIFSYLAQNVNEVSLPSRDPLGNSLYVASDLGITVTESLGTVALIDIPPRWGVDHLWSVLRRIPEGAVGFDDPFPPRIVRRSTEIFSSAEDQDIPPGWMGMMWLDFRWFGPVIYGMVFGAGLAFIERGRRRCEVDLQASAVFAVGLFIYCLPVNTGSLDFSFSVDVIFLVVLVALALRLKGTAAVAAGVRTEGAS